MIAFLRIHVCCILKLMHLLTFIRIFIVAFGTRCIHVHLNASKFGCIFIACCILVHSSHKMHSRAFFVCCILYMPHLNAFQYILSLVRFECAAFYLWCIWMHHYVFHSALRRKNTRFRWAPGRVLLASWCLRMHMNAHECTRMRQNAPKYTRDHTHTYTREAERTQGQTHGRIWAGRAVGVP